MNLITLDAALDHLRVGDSPADIDDISAKLAEASDIVRDYVTVEGKDTWDASDSPNDVPFRVQAAVKLVLEALYDGEPDPLTDGARNLLRRLRTPSLS